MTEIIALTKCFEDTSEYLYVEGRRNFSDAVLSCESVESSLVKIDTEEKFTFISNFTFTIVNADYWVGLSRETGTDPNSPQSFRFQDESSIGVNDFGGQNGKFPWQFGQPNADDQECILVENEFGKWQDEVCNRERRVVCERPCGSALIVEEEDEVEIIVFVLPVIAVLIVGVIIALVVQVRLYQKETIEAEVEGSVETLSKEDDTVNIRNINDKNTLQTEDEDSDILIPSPKNQKISAVDRSHTDMSETVLSF